MIESPQMNGWGNNNKIPGLYKAPRNYIWCSKAGRHLGIKNKDNDRFYFKYNTDENNDAVRVSNPRDHSVTMYHIIALSLTQEKAQRIMLALMCRV